jgi:hypothetical protein
MPAPCDLPGGERYQPAKSERTTLLFEEEQLPVILGLGLHRDGVLPVGIQFSAK